MSTVPGLVWAMGARCRWHSRFVRARNGVCLGEGDAGQGGDFLPSTRLAPLVITSTDVPSAAFFKDDALGDLRDVALGATVAVCCGAAGVFELDDLGGAAVGSEPVPVLLSGGEGGIGQNTDAVS